MFRILFVWCVVVFCFLSFPLFSQVNISGSFTLCEGEAGFFSANTTSISSANSFTWSSVPATSLISSPGVSATTIVFPSAGIYTIALTISGGNTNYYAYHTVTVFPAPQLVLSSSNPSLCFGQDATLTVSGAPNYVWDTLPGMYFLNASSAQISPGLTTTYSVTGTNTFGCKAMTSIVQYVFANPSIVLVPTSTIVCPGGTSTINALGATSYTWTGTSFSGSIMQSSLVVSAGSYTVAGSNGNVCFDTMAVTIGSTFPLSVLVSASRATLCLNPDAPEPPVVLSAGGANTYVWAPYVPAYMTYSLGPQTTVSPTVTTCYTVTGSTAICTGTAVLCVHVSDCTDLAKNSGAEFFTLFPNPARDKLHLTGELGLTKLEIRDVFGKVLILKVFDPSHGSEQIISLNEIPDGVYLVNVYIADHPVQTKRMVKKE